MKFVEPRPYADPEAVARKLMVALWRYLKEDLIPEGAVLA